MPDNKRLSFFLFIFFLLRLPYGFADTLVDAHSLTYYSEFEERVFKSFIDGKSEDYLALYLSMDSTADESVYNTTKTALSLLVDEFREPSYKKMKKSKYIKKIYNSIHSKLLDKYTLITDFSDAFSNGEYQCVTGSMLYALVFDELEIPYKIKLQPNHAFLIAYPETDYILVETTNPMKGTMIFSEQFKNNFVDNLRDSKLISKEEYASTSKADLFDKYYNKPEIIDKKQLAGAQYSNMALAAMELMEFKYAFHCMEKACYFYPNEKNNYLLLINLAAAIERTSFSTDEYAELLGKLIMFHGKSITTQQVVGMFAQLTYRQLEYEGNLELYKRSYHTIIENVKDSALNAEISFMYNYEVGRKLVAKMYFEEARPYVERCYQLKPRNSEVENLFFSLLTNIINKSLYNNESKVDLLNELEEYKERNPQLANNYNFKSYWLKLCLTIMDDAYYAKEVEKAEKYRLLFEEFYPESEYELQELDSFIVHAYMTAAAYYFQKNNYKKSREMLNIGLRYSPNNMVLKERLRYLR